MAWNFFDGISQRNARVSMFVFFSLLFLSVTFFVFADDSVSDKNIFQDSDQDGLSNDEEVLYKTDPMNKDTDGDGYTDGVEVESGYDPLKPAPGDKLIQTTEATDTSKSSTGGANLTDQVSSEIVTMAQGSTEGKEVTMEEVNDSIQKVIDQEAEKEIVLPEVNTDEIKIKSVSKKLKAKQREEQEREDALQYLTVMAYILGNNSPKSFHTEGDLSSIMSSFGTNTLSALVSGDTKSLDEFSKRGEKMLKEIKDVEVPEGMASVHIKAIKMAKYSMTLKDEAQASGTDDPLGKIASLSKIQGFLTVAADFSQEIFSKLNDYGIKEIPVNF